MLVEEYSAVRHATERFSALLAVEDQMLQAMDDVSPNKWPSRRIMRYAAEPHASDLSELPLPLDRWQFKGLRLADDLS